MKARDLILALQSIDEDCEIIIGDMRILYVPDEDDPGRIYVLPMKD